MRDKKKESKDKQDKDNFSSTGESRNLILLKNR